MIEQNIQAQWRNTELIVERPRPKNHHPNLERLICAAVSNARFAALLIKSPEVALAQSEVGRRLTNAERRLVLAIVDAEDIYEFAGRLHAAVLAFHNEATEVNVLEVDAAPVVERRPMLRSGRPAPRHELHVAECGPGNFRNKHRQRTV